MKMKSKALLLIMTTFIMGVAIGALGHRAWLRTHFKRVEAFREHRGMPKFIEKKIRPTPQQTPRIRELLKEHDKRFIAFRKKQHKEIKEFMDSLKSELEPLLTDEQKKRLSKNAPPPRHEFGPRGPHPEDFKPAPHMLPHHQRISKKDFVNDIIAVAEPDSSQLDTLISVLSSFQPDKNNHRVKGLPPDSVVSDIICKKLSDILRPDQIKRVDDLLRRRHSFPDKPFDKNSKPRPR